LSGESGRSAWLLGGSGQTQPRAEGRAAEERGGVGCGPRRDVTAGADLYQPGPRGVGGLMTMKCERLGSSVRSTRRGRKERGASCSSAPRLPAARPCGRNRGALVNDEPFGFFCTAGSDGIDWLGFGQLCCCAGGGPAGFSSDGAQKGRSHSMGRGPASFVNCNLQPVQTVGTSVKRVVEAASGSILAPCVHVTMYVGVRGVVAAQRHVNS
jgi:hypothetical protein